MGVLRLVAEDAARRAAIQAAEADRRATIESARARIPSRFYELPLVELQLSTRALEHLKRASLSSAGDVMERLAEGDEGLLKLDGIGPKSLAEIKQCVEALALPEEPMPAEEVTPTVEEALVEAAPPVEEPLVAALEVAAEAPAAAVEVEAVEEVVAVPEALAEVEVAPAVVGEAPTEEATAREVVVEGEPALEGIPGLFVEEGEEDEFGEGRDRGDRKRDRQARRQLIYDESLGKMVAHRRRKREPGVDEWGEY